jgi:transcription-repair coupling factor (superfamily II helicase)
MSAVFINNFMEEKSWIDFMKYYNEGTESEDDTDKSRKKQNLTNSSPKSIIADEDLWSFIIGVFGIAFKFPVFVLTSTLDRANEITRELESLLGNHCVYLYPSIGISIFSKNRAVAGENIIARLDVLRKIIEYSIRHDRQSFPFIIVATANSIIDLIPEQKISYKRSLNIGLHKKTDREELISNLVEMGYERVNKVFDRGEFSAKGDVIDVFDITFDSPARIDLLDESVNKIILYDLNDQSTIEKLDEISIFPNVNIWEINEPDNEPDNIQDINQKAGYVSLIYFIANYVRDFGFIVCDPVEVSLKIKSDIDIIQKSIEIENMDSMKPNLERGIEKNRIKNLSNRVISLNFLEDVVSKSLIYRLDLNSSEFEAEDLNSFIFDRISKQKKSYGNSEIFIQNLKRDLNNKKVVIISLENAQRIEKIKQLLLDSGVSFKDYQFNNNNQFLERNSVFSEIRFRSLDINLINILNLELYSGYESEGISLYGELDVYEQLEKDIGKSISIFEAKHEEFIPGDYVVHRTHGIGRYVEIISEQIDGHKREYFLIEYADNDKLYVPTWQADRIDKYIGDRTPTISSLTSKQWENIKKKVRSSVYRLAIDLASLYAERNMIEGYAYPEDSVWQQEMEELFPFRETHDQLKATNYVKELMQKPKPMDLLVCGDVGFGKTEVAVRAAFKAVENEKQVLMLVPTTILADQHFRTFSERFKSFPVIVEVISRFRSKREQKEILKNFCEGKIDMLIGTHRILSEDIKSKDLGLVIVDEEHRFGVNAKEKIKLLKKEVDVLTLTATPIPRTLYMSLTGIRDVVLIGTHPMGRFPIETFVGVKNNFVIRMAVDREIKRGGQVYYVFNRIRDINEKKYKLQSLLPDARIALTHGRMEGKEIEKIMQDFLDKKYDILLTTTIIESGMDISNVNTLIVEDAHRFGLAQLYQIRGRVGRSWQKAYAYFFYPDKKILNLTAFQRLKTLAEHTDLGSGYKIALRDLEIRGSGELLGARQHGYINNVGFDLYCQIVREEVEKLKGLTVEEDINIQIELPVSAYIPKNFIGNEGDRINLYKSLGSIKAQGEVEDILLKLKDRFGSIPEVVINLVNIAKIKCLSRKARIEKVIYLKGRGVVLRKIFLPQDKIRLLVDKNPLLTYIQKSREILIKISDEKIDTNLVISSLNDIISLI